MALLDNRYGFLDRMRLFSGMRNMRIRTKLLIVLIPSVVIILIITGYAAYIFSKSFLQTALERIGIVQTLALAHEMETTLENARKDLLFFAGESPDPAAMRDYLEKLRAVRQMRYCEFAYIPYSGENAVFLGVENDKVHELSSKDIRDIHPSPFLFAEKARTLSASEAAIGPIINLDYHFQTADNRNVAVSTEGLRLAATHPGPGKTPEGVYVLTLNVRSLRNILSVYNSPRSPVWGFARSQEVRFSYLFDPEGWILFQSEDPGKEDGELTTYLARAGYSGALGKGGLSAAFRPESKFESFWKMVNDVRDGQYGVINEPDNETHEPGYAKYFYLCYAPIRFRPSAGAEPVIVAGVGNLDKSRLTLLAGYRQIDVIFVITLGAILLIAALIYILSRNITKPIFDLSRAADNIQQHGNLEEIQLPDVDFETTFLKNALNRMLCALRDKVEEIRVRDKKIELVNLRGKADLGGGPAVSMPDGLDALFPEIVGRGSACRRLKAELVKAAQVDADVLIIGETGSGKQLMAEAIHRRSRRSAGPLISINCGALDENLLLDVLFGHVKGAFTEARQDRKGAFLQADGGILFLDEIQTATPKVQQALLRAIAMRRIRPLGSDQEIAVDVRIISAANVDLKTMIDAGTFREDLYFRLKVITVHSPPLRVRKEDIPCLAAHFLRRAEKTSGKIGLGLSRGALERLTLYDWPGNIRELEHCLLRASVMCESSLIQADDVLLENGSQAGAGNAARHPGADGQETPDETAGPLPGEYSAPEPHSASMAGPGPETGNPDQPPQEAVSPNGPPEASASGAARRPKDVKTNPRQAKAMPFILKNNGVTRTEYQELLGGLPPRTAIYDLSDLVKKGVLVKTGAGPSTRYQLAPEDHS